MPSSTDKIFNIILGGYEEFDNKEADCLRGGKLPILAAIIGFHALAIDIIDI